MVATSSPTPPSPSRTGPTATSCRRTVRPWSPSSRMRSGTARCLSWSTGCAAQMAVSSGSSRALSRSSGRTGRWSNGSGPGPTSPSAGSRRSARPSSCGSATRCGRSLTRSRSLPWRARRSGDILRPGAAATERWTRPANSSLSSVTGPMGSWRASREGIASSISAWSSPQPIARGGPSSSTMRSRTRAPKGPRLPSKRPAECARASVCR